MGVSRFQYYVGHRVEALALGAVMKLFGALPAHRASALGGAVGRLAGRVMGRANRIAERNLTLCFPEMPADERQALRRRMWTHFGRVLAEMPHTQELWQHTTEKSALASLDDLRHARDGEASAVPLVIVGAHYGNWEIGGFGAQDVFPPTGVFYRPLNNRFADALLQRLRGGSGVAQFAKGRDGGRSALRHLRAGGTLAVLMDQKMREGIDAPFFGHPARTPYAAVLFALKTGAPIVPMVVRRIDGARFELDVAPRIENPRSGDRDEDIRLIVTAINARIEAWIRQAPEQWLWIHRRWSIDYDVRKK
ncbi:lysophospholipid acyltransferase family protein [Fodinicurvata sp. EGI_FJ10296]|uniref:lysophospholipid acyltransferase family protein n=1 Tax=Fodinicurvata sp. EGI_FJ10296 TaxID=3231908 RepID=UPI003455613A